MVTVPAKLNFVRIDPDLELNLIRPEEAVRCSAKSRGEDQHDEDHYGAWKSTAHQTLNTPINSIVAAAKTAYDLESARRKATRDKGQISLTFPK
jgi:hypothetical protein